MRHYEHLQWGPDTLRLAPWRGDPTIAELSPAGNGRPPGVDTVRQGLALVEKRGYRSAITSALAAEEQHGYLDAGFEVLERLHLLSRGLDRLPDAPPSRRLRRGRRSDLPRLLELDSLAFDPFWQLDALRLDDARRATPSSRLRVTAERPLAGYAVTGRAGTRGYLQRLAVTPEHQGQGWGRALVVDALRWLRRRGAMSVTVNTQEANERALRLYHQLGFSTRPEGLAVLVYRFGSR